jgi:hypothetical protein
MNATEGISGSYFVPHYEGTLPWDELRSAMLFSNSGVRLLPLWINLKRNKDLLGFNATLFIRIHFQKPDQNSSPPASKPNDLSILGLLVCWASTDTVHFWIYSFAIEYDTFSLTAGDCEPKIGVLILVGHISSRFQ